jgi:tetratricopeptide (TPR) repeat protein
MSLLIKALDHLDKNKRAEKDKKQTGDYVADAALMLELVPVDAENAVETSQAIGDSAAVSELVKSNLIENGVVDKHISLEEEAGLTGATFSANQYAKPKPRSARDSSKSSAQSDTVPSSTVKNTPQEAVSAANAKNKAATTATHLPAFQTPTVELNQKAAAKVFVANQEVREPSSKFTLIILGVVGALLVWLGMQGYGYIKILAAPDVVVVKPSLPIQTQAVNDAPAAESIELPVEVATANQVVLVQQIPSSKEGAGAIAGFDSKTDKSAFKNKVIEKPDVVDDVIEAEPNKLRSKKTSNNNVENYSDSEVSLNAEERSNTKNKSLTLIAKPQLPGVDPTLLAAYQAFTRGEDSLAQQKYRQVLQQDVRNVDALLGMAAIAQRQGRDADAQGWYQKVLEIEPRNTIAQSAMVTPRANTDVVGTESRIKSMIAQQPEGANLHAALGNLYAEQGQWPSAQEAYFNASRLAPNNADYAFNLAISLDQMGKSSLALKQYQRALDLLNKSDGSSPDRVQLEARIRELQ